MLISTRGRYALRMMIDLAAHEGEGFIALKDIAQRQQISKKYLEQIIPVLNHSGLLQTVRGAGGGYRLVKKPEEYTVGEILRVTEGNLAPVSCLESGVNTCPKCEECMTLSIWSGLQQVVDSFLDSITLKSVLEGSVQSPETFLRR